MKTPRMALAGAAALLLLAIPAGSAGAVEIGSRCAAEGAGDGLVVPVGQIAGGPTYVAPSAGVITSWGANIASVGSWGFRLKLVVPGSVPGNWLVTGESSQATFTTGLNTIPARLPIAAGTSIATFSSTGAATCLTGVPLGESTADEKFRSTDVPIGQELDTNSTSLGSRLALFATIEPDVDGDGFGDESQDLCTQRADMQSACPTVAITSVKRTAGKKSLKLTVATNTAASLTASVSARVPASGGRKARTIKFKAKIGGPSFTFKYPSKLRRALRALPKRKKVKLTVQISASGLINQDIKTYTVKLRGRG